MVTNQKGLTLIKSFESLSLVAYPDPGSPLGREVSAHGIRLNHYHLFAGWSKLQGHPWTIGYGHTGPEVHAGMVITQTQADQYLINNLKSTEIGVTNLLHVTVTSNQFSALVSLAYNIGFGNFAGSTLLKLLNSGKNCADQFLLWNQSEGHVLDGLTRRRTAERDLFLNRI